jgi:formate/nitrite transporter FocA (FNT family)
MHMQVVHNAYTPKETTELCSRAGTMKGNMRADKVFMSSFIAGCLLAFACACTVSFKKCDESKKVHVIDSSPVFDEQLLVSASPWFQENAPGVVLLLSAIIFPWGLVAILSTGTDLCTGSFMVGFH